ncbi:MAG: DUF5937 family protein [Acidimicrobiales bacterium]
MIRLWLEATDLARMRFAYSPLTEMAESLYMLHSDRIHPAYRPWYDHVRPRVAGPGQGLLEAVVPARGCLANFFFGAVAGSGTTADSQLRWLSEYPPDLLRSDLDEVWGGETLPEPAQRLLAAGPAAPKVLADTLFRYWEQTIRPYWPQARALLDADVAYRLDRLAKGGIEGLLSDLHPELRLQGRAIVIDRRRHTGDHDLADAGLTLVPCAFAWPNLVVATSPSAPPSITYSPRGVGTLWDTPAAPAGPDDALRRLIGRNRAAVLDSIRLPRSTTEIALALCQSPAAVSTHLALLRRCQLVTSWRSGRRVLYQRTPLGDSIVAVCATDNDALDRGAS